jgi:ABC-type Fe3+/spermidine/putrescine transport system ATPase subunit
LAAAVLRLEHLSKSFGRVKAVDDVSLEIQEGEIFALLGPSGCGKTTTLRLLAGLETPDDGRIVLRDRPIAAPAEGIFVPPHKRNMGMVFQSYAIWPHKTVFENVAYPLRVRRVKGSEVQERVLRTLDLVGLTGLENRQGPQLSGGQQQRVALARALVYEPSVLLLDEPFSNLDAKLREQMRVQLKMLLREVRITAVFVTHDQVEALSLSDRVALMNEGKVEQAGTPRDLYERPATAFVRDFLGTTVLLRGTTGALSPGGGVVVDLRSAPGVRLEVPSGEMALSPGSDVWVAVRPEDITLQTDSEGRQGPRDLHGTVEALLFVGDHQECRVRVAPDEALFVHAPRALVLREGDSVSLTLAAEALSLWPA